MHLSLIFKFVSDRVSRHIRVSITPLKQELLAMVQNVIQRFFFIQLNPLHKYIIYHMYCSLNVIYMGPYGAFKAVRHDTEVFLYCTTVYLL